MLFRQLPDNGKGRCFASSGAPLDPEYLIISAQGGVYQPPLIIVQPLTVSGHNFGIFEWSYGPQLISAGKYPLDSFSFDIDQFGRGVARCRRIRADVSNEKEAAFLLLLAGELGFHVSQERFTVRMPQGIPDHFEVFENRAAL
jgi:hypothetical protein